MKIIPPLTPSIIINLILYLDIKFNLNNETTDILNNYGWREFCVGSNTTWTNWIRNLPKNTLQKIYIDLIKIKN